MWEKGEIWPTRGSIRAQHAKSARFICGLLGPRDATSHHTQTCNELDLGFVMGGCSTGVFRRPNLAMCGGSSRTRLDDGRKEASSLAEEARAQMGANSSASSTCSRRKWRRMKGELSTEGSPAGLTRTWLPAPMHPKPQHRKPRTNF